MSLKKSHKPQRKIVRREKRQQQSNETENNKVTIVDVCLFVITCE